MVFIGRVLYVVACAACLFFISTPLALAGVAAGAVAGVGIVAGIAVSALAGPPGWGGVGTLYGGGPRGGRVVVSQLRGTAAVLIAARAPAAGTAVVSAAAWLFGTPA